VYLYSAKIKNSQCAEVLH